MKTNKEKILQANQLGLHNPDWSLSFYTPIYQMAYNLGCKGIDLSLQPDVRGYRYGVAPESGLSRNYRDGISECGLSLAVITTPGYKTEEIGSAMFFSNRKKHYFKGMLLPCKGSDGEPLILMYGAEDFDN